MSPQLALFKEPIAPVAVPARALLDLSWPGSTIALHGPAGALTIVNACVAHQDGRVMWLVREPAGGGTWRGVAWIVTGDPDARPANLGPGRVPPYRWYDAERAA